MNETFKEQLDKHNENERLGLYKEAHDLNPYRSQVLDEVADAILKMEGFGKDTLHSFAIYIRGLK